METILLSVALLGLAFAGIAIKILVKKDGKFAGTCSSNNPMLQTDDGTCGICGATREEKCQSEQSPS
ncbi:MAG: membrane or secreted protein [Flavobacteriales bacterium]|nr:membrane or secreted protein [Flavobacteriales bacterium]